VNHLAHALLAGPDDALIAGSLLGDFWRGTPDPAWPRALAAGVRLHRRVDASTDSHAAVVRARRLFAPPFRRYAGILLDVWFDHLLARDFARWSGGESLRAFCDRCYAGLLRVLGGAAEGAPTAPPLPPVFRLYVSRIVQDDGLAAYVNRAHVEPVLARISARLARANPVEDALPILESLERPLDAAFAALIPDLIAFAAAERRTLL
jgi:acyl carrier protein phosphodiesterase